MGIRRAVRRVGITILLSFAMATAPLYTFAATPPSLSAIASPDVFITEIQTATAASGSEEFVELYNNTNNDIDFADTAHTGKDVWKLQYFSSGSKFESVRTSPTSTGWNSPSGSIALTGVIPAHDYYVLAGITASGNYTPGSLDADQHYSPHLSSETVLQLVDIPSTSSTIYHDRVLWSNDQTKQGGPNGVLAAPAAGSSLQRMPTGEDSYINEDGTLTAFTVDSAISPKDAWEPPVPTPTPDPATTDPTTDPSSDEGDTSTPTQTTDNPTNVGLLSPAITELLPNPASPATDDQDEYIELYNPNATPFNLNGYTIEAGTTTLHDFTFTSDTLLPGNEYAVFTSGVTGLALSNSGGQARLLDPSGAKLSETGAYGTAADGQAWALDPSDNTWKWTTVPTPADANSIVVANQTDTPAEKKAAVAKTAKKTTKSTKAAGTKTTKAKAAKKTTKTKKLSATSAANGGADQRSNTTPIHPWTLAVVAGLAVAYGLYEYRYDLANRIYQFRKHRAARGRARYALQGR